MNTHQVFEINMQSDKLQYIKSFRRYLSWMPAEYLLMLHT